MIQIFKVYPIVYNFQTIHNLFIKLSNSAEFQKQHQLRESVELKENKAKVLL